MAVRFGFDFTKPPTPKEVFEVAALAKQAGWSIDKEQLEEQTGYTLIKDEANGLNGLNGPSGLNAASRLNAFANKETPPSGDRPRADSESATLAAFAKDTTPAAKAIQALLKNPSKEAAEALLKDLPNLIPNDPALEAVIANEMAKAFGPVANKTDAQGNEHAESGEGGGQFVAKGGGSSSAPSAKTEKPVATDDEVKSFLADPPARIKEGQAEALLRAGFDDSDGSGNKVHYGKLLLNHLNTNGHSEKDAKARKERLGIAVKMIRESTPAPSGNPNKSHERIYMGHVDGKAYIAVADEHNEIDALEMVSYRRDRAND